MQSRHLMIKYTQCLQLDQLVQLRFLLLAGMHFPFAVNSFVMHLIYNAPCTAFGGKKKKVGYYSIFKAKIEKGCIKHLGGRRRE